MNKYLKKNRVLMAAAVSLLAVSTLFAGCNKNASNEPNKPHYVLPLTEKDYRNSIALLTGDDATSLSMKQQYYESLKELDVFTEADYLALAETYNKLGNKIKARATLVELHRLYPSAEYINKINEISFSFTDSDSAFKNEAELIGAVSEKLDALAAADISEFSVAANAEALGIIDIFTSDKWATNLSDGLVGVDLKANYTGAEYYCEINSGYDGISLRFVYNDKSVRSVSLSDDELVINYSVYLNSAFNGDFKSLHFTKQGALKSAATGTFKDNLCKSKVTVKVFDADSSSADFCKLVGDYSGKVQNNGTTGVEKYDVIEEKGFVVYAVDEAKGSYLYAPAKSRDELILNNEFFGIR